MRILAVRVAAPIVAALAVAGLSACSADVSSADRADAQVAAKEKAVAQAQSDLDAASAAFCEASEDYVRALDRYGDILNDTAPTVGDVREAGADLAEPRSGALEDAEAVSDAQDELARAEQELADARAAQVEASGAASPTAVPTSSATPLAPPASIERVKQAEAEYDAAQGAISDETPLEDAAEQFNAAVVALEFAWLRLFVDAGCLDDTGLQQAEAAVSAYVSPLQQELADAGYYDGEIDGVYGPLTVAAVEELQAANGLPVTGTVDKATAEALQAELLALGGAAAQESIATTAAVQQTLKLVGFWDGPVDGVWTPELTEAVKALQTALGVEPTGAVDAATISAFQMAIAALQEPDASPSPEPTPEPSPST